MMKLSRREIRSIEEKLPKIQISREKELHLVWWDGSLAALLLPRSASLRRQGYTVFGVVFPYLRIHPTIPVLCALSHIGCIDRIRL
jgi:hypothetical protein